MDYIWLTEVVSTDITFTKAFSSKELATSTLLDYIANKYSDVKHIDYYCDEYLDYHMAVMGYQEHKLTKTKFIIRPVEYIK